MFRILIAVSLPSILASSLWAVRPAGDSDDEVDYGRDVRPILADACFHCHGPDEEHRQAGLRLDSFDDATEDLGGYRAIEPGDLDASESWLRIQSDDEDAVMPPPESGKSLSPEQIEVLRKWIEQGAPYAEHWAFQPPQRAALPDVDDPIWSQHRIDRWIHARLDEESLRPSPPADRATLLRRLSLDLIGLPPTPEEVAAFQNDPSSDAYDRQVERLLASEHYGERWGRIWLDAARYADSDGYEKDKPRSAYFYRDWVARALNDDMPFDQFVIRQIAGDLLPNATQDDRVATGFLRNSMINEEGGVDPEQFRMEAMFDRMDAIGKSVLGLTVQCAQCHSHKYDPISHTDYYRMFAMLNDCHESSITVYTDEQFEKRREVLAKINATYDDWLQKNPEFQVAFDQFVASASVEPTDDWEPLSIDWIESSIAGQKYLPQSDGSYLQQSYAATFSNSKGDAVVTRDQPIHTLRLDVLRDPNLPHGGPGRSVDGTWALTDMKLSYSLDDGKQWKEVKFAEAVATINPPKRRLEPRYHAKQPDPDRVTGPVRFAIDGDRKTAWTGNLSPGRRNDPQTAYFRLAEPILPSTGAGGDASTLTLRVEVGMNHGGWNSDDNQTHNLGRFRIAISDRSKDFDLVPPKLRDEGFREDNRGEWLAHFVSTLDGLSDEATQGVEATKAAVEQCWDEFPVGASQLVVSHREEGRTTHRLDRGDFLSPRESVTGGTPGFLHPLPEGASGNRMDLARWLVDSNSPTTARSIVNRIWQAYFGIGLSATADDLGLMGEPPSHLELLDDLAVELMDQNWRLKPLHRMIVSSQTYRQSSRVTPELLEADPDNRLLARSPRFRVPAEMVRDIALSASGLLNRQVGGPPVFPPAPDFLFVPPASYGPKTWDTSEGADRYRRGFYTFRFRSVPYPAFQAFDAPTGEVSCVRRSRSNTPLQALVTMNEPMFVECAQHLADEILEGPDVKPADRIASLYRRCVSRQPSEREIAIVQDLVAAQQERFDAQPEIAEALLGEPSSEGQAERAAWMVAARVVLNLDETITRP